MRAFPLQPRLGAATAAGLLATVVVGLYVAVVAVQGHAGGREALVASSLALAAASAFAAPAVDDSRRAILLGWAAGTLWLWTLLGLASIGLMILPSAALVTYALVRTPSSRLAPLSSAGAAVFLLTFGLSWT